MLSLLCQTCGKAFTVTCRYYLGRSCNSRVNFGREKWTVLFYKMMYERFPNYFEDERPQLALRSAGLLEVVS
jgi:hypothetical protein